MGGFCEKLPENFLMSNNINASWPKIDLPLAKAKPARGDGSRGKNCCRIAAGKSRENVRKTTLQTQRSVQKEGQEVVQALEMKFPCSLW